MRLVLVILVLLGGPAFAQGYAPRATQSHPTWLRLQETLLGQPMSFDSIVLTQSDPSVDTLTLAGGRLRFYPEADAANAVMFYDPAYGLTTYTGLRVGGYILTNGLLNYSQNGPVAVDEANGLKLTCQSALPGTCGVGTITQATIVTLCATASSRTRTCTCTASSNSSPTYAWALDGGAGAVGTTTTCPEVTP